MYPIFSRIKANALSYPKLLPRMSMKLKHNYLLLLLLLLPAYALAECPAYDRKAWKHWVDADRDCQNTRHEVLIEESQTPVVFKTEKGCKVVAGSWMGAYSGEVFTDASKLDIDHMVPLKEAHESGGHAWDAYRKRDYANDLSDPNTLREIAQSLFEQGHSDKVLSAQSVSNLLKQKVA